jgi:hypothetical protein
MIVWDSQARNWFELDEDAVDALAEFGSEVAEGHVTGDNALQVVIQTTRAVRMGAEPAD